MRMARLVRKKLTKGMVASYARQGKNIAKMLSNPSGTVKMFGELTKHQIKSNPFIKHIIRHRDVDTKEYAEAFKRMSEEELPSMATLRTLSKSLNIQDPQELVDLTTKNPDFIVKHIGKMTNAQREDLRVSIESDTNEAPLSSSWLSYGTYVSDKNNPNRGVLYLTPAKGNQFKTPPTTLAIWEKMKRKVGRTTYNKDGTRKGANYGAGTILHQYIPRSTWRVVRNPEEQKRAPEKEKQPSKTKQLVDKKIKKTINKNDIVKTYKAGKKNAKKLSKKIKRK